MTINMIPIGTIYTSFESLEGMPIQPSGAKETKGTIVLDPAYEEGLNDIEGFSHIILLFYLHRSKGFDLMVKPFLDDQKRGLFSTRAPRRPNPIGLSTVRLIKRTGPKLIVKGIDILNNTPLIDIKPYVPQFDLKEDIRSGWLEKNQARASFTKSDDRFVES